MCGQIIQNTTSNTVDASKKKSLFNQQRECVQRLNCCCIPGALKLPPQFQDVLRVGRRRGRWRCGWAQQGLLQDLRDAWTRLRSLEIVMELL